MATQSKIRVIRKYPNRRLYDTEESRYITIADIRDLVLQSVEFQVIDKKSGDDITRCILLQVICEQEQNGQAILSEKFLSQVICAYSHVASDLLAEQLEDSTALFLSHNGRIKEEAVDFAGNNLSQKTP